MSGLKKLNYEQTAFFFEQMWLMVNTGMQLDDGLEILGEDSEDSNICKVCRFLSEKTAVGIPINEAMAESGVFPRYSVKMAEIGSVTGKLDETLKGLSEYYENRADIEKTVRYAVFHPFMLLIMMTVVMVVMVVKIIPVFSDIFEQFDSGIGSVTENVVGAAYTAGQAVLIMLISVIILTAVIILIPPIKRGVLRLASVLPGTRRISRTLSQAKLADAMCMMVTGGIDPEEALEYASELIDDKKLLLQIKDCLKRIHSGEYFSEAVSSSGIFPKMYGRSLKLSYTSGSFDEVWKKISRRSNEEAQRTVSNILSLVEPLIVLISAVMIGSVLLTIMLPLMNIMSALG